MIADFEVPDDQIVTRVVEGNVTIEGIVARESQKKAAEACVSKVKGVRGVANKIAVGAAALPEA
jgi:osmotically-inducible protein OsmY